MFTPTWFICGGVRRARARAADSEGRFAPVAVAAANSVARPMGSDAGVGLVIEVVLRNGRVLRVPEGVAAACAARLADALEGYGR